MKGERKMKEKEKSLSFLTSFALFAFPTSFQHPFFSDSFRLLEYYFVREK